MLVLVLAALLLIQLSVLIRLGRQWKMTHVFGLLYPPLETQVEFRVPRLQLGPAPTIVPIWGVIQWVKDLPLSPHSAPTLPLK